MTVTAERVLQELKHLSPEDLQEMWQEISRLMNSMEAGPNLYVPTSTRDGALKALDSLQGRFAGSQLLNKLLNARKEERLREEAKWAKRSLKNG